MIHNLKDSPIFYTVCGCLWLLVAVVLYAERRIIVAEIPILILAAASFAYALWLVYKYRGRKK